MSITARRYRPDQYLIRPVRFLRSLHSGRSRRSDLDVMFSVRKCPASFSSNHAFYRPENLLSNSGSAETSVLLAAFLIEVHSITRHPEALVSLLRSVLGPLHAHYHSYPTAVKWVPSSYKVVSRNTAFLVCHGVCLKVTGHG